LGQVLHDSGRQWNWTVEDLVENVGLTEQKRRLRTDGEGKSSGNWLTQIHLEN